MQNVEYGVLRVGMGHSRSSTAWTLWTERTRLPIFNFNRNCVYGPLGGDADRISRQCLASENYPYRVALFA